MSSRKVLVAVFIVTVGLLISLPLAAHHGGASILSGKQVTMKATVTEWLWTNPHCLLRFEVKGDDGKVVQWVAETPAPSTVYPFGYRKDSFKPQDQITITLNPVKSGVAAGSIVRVLRPDGTTLERIQERAQ